MEQLAQLVATLEQQNKIKKDYAILGKRLWYSNGQLMINGESYAPSVVFHNQIADSLAIPRAYYQRMLNGHSTLLDENVNRWLRFEDKTKLIRTFENEINSARAYLSDRYSIVDNYQVLFETLEAIKQTGLEVDIIAAELSEAKMYLKVVCPAIELKAGELLERYSLTRKVGDGVISGFVLENSEIGLGKFSIAPRAVVLACRNGLIYKKDALNKIHLGAKLDELSFNENASVREANLKLIKEQVKHAVKVFLSKDYLQRLINVYKTLGTKEIEAHAANVIEVVANEYSINADRKNNILNYFIKGGDTRRIGIVNAITEEVQGLSDVDARHDSEMICFDILNKFESIEAKAFRTPFKAN